MNVEIEILDLKRRVGELEGGFGFLSSQLRGVHRDLIAFQERAEQRFDRLETDVAHLKTDVGQLKSDVGQLKSDVGQLKSDVGLLKTEVKQLRAELPEIVGTVMREVLREQRT